MPEVAIEVPEASVENEKAPAADWWHRDNAAKATQDASRRREQLQRAQAQAQHRAEIEAFHSLAKTRWTDALKTGKADQAEIWFEAGRAIGDGAWLDHKVIRDDPGIKRFNGLRQSLREVMTESDRKAHQEEGKAFLAHAGRRFQQALKDGDNEAAEAWNAAARAVHSGEWVHSEIVNADMAAGSFQALKARLISHGDHVTPKPPEVEPPRPRPPTSADRYQLDGQKEWVITKEMRADPAFMLDPKNKERIKNARFV